jgi:phage protein D/phage baseplate assembly protein gpV
MMPKVDFLSQIYIKIKGRNASKETFSDIEEVVVDTSLNLPDMFTITLADDFNFKWIDSKTFDVGEGVEISAKAEGESQSVLLLKGEITAIEPEFSEKGGAIMVIRGYDKAHRLHRVKKTRVFTQSTDSDIVSAIAQEDGLWYDGDRTRVVYEHVFQDYQTDMEFIQDRARRNGYFAYVEDRKLHFCQEPKTTGTVPVLEWGVDLLDFHPRLSTAEQVVDSNVHGWDVQTKKAILGKSTAPKGTPRISGQSHGGKAAQKAHKVKGEEHVSDHPVSDQKEAEAVAQSILNEKAGAFFQAEGTCDGNPKVRAGAMVEIKSIGERFSGRYLVTRAIHRYDDFGYTTKFEISGHRANTLGQLLDSKDGNGYGVVVGVVTNAKDPKDMARVKVKYPTISDQLESNWARVLNPMAGPQRGIEFLPEVNDEVLVAFEYNDFNKPYILGALWNGKDKPPLTTKDAVNDKGVNKRIIKTRCGHTITLDDTEKAEKISILSKSGHTIILDDTDGKEKISTIDKTKKNSIEIDSAKNTLTIKADGDITIGSTTGNVMIKGKDITFDATANANMKAKSNINLEATTKATVTGKAGVDVGTSAAPTNVKGAVINLN